MRTKVIKGRKSANWWTPERRELLWKLYIEGVDYAAIAKLFDASVAAIQTQIYKTKRTKQ